MYPWPGGLLGAVIDSSTSMGVQDIVSDSIGPHELAKHDVVVVLIRVLVDDQDWIL